jgi:hypothetical protein
MSNNNHVISSQNNTISAPHNILQNMPMAGHLLTSPLLSPVFSEFNEFFDDVNQLVNKHFKSNTAFGNALNNIFNDDDKLPIIPDYSMYNKFMNDELFNVKGPYTYSHSFSEFRGPNDISERHEYCADNYSGKERIAVQRSIGERGRTIITEKKLNSSDNDKNTIDRLDGMKEEDVENFNEEWKKYTGNNKIYEDVGNIDNKESDELRQDEFRQDELRRLTHSNKRHNNLRHNNLKHNNLRRRLKNNDNIPQFLIN